MCHAERQAANNEISGVEVIPSGDQQVVSTATELLLAVAEQEPWLSHSTKQYRHHLALQSHTLKMHDKLIQENYVAIVQHLDVEHVLPFIIADGILSDEQHQLILHQPSRQAQVRELLSILRKKGDQGFYSLCHATLQSKRQQGKNYFLQQIYSLTCQGGLHSKDPTDCTVLSVIFNEYGNSQ